MSVVHIRPRGPSSKGWEEQTRVHSAVEEPRRHLKNHLHIIKHVAGEKGRNGESKDLKSYGSQLGVIRPPGGHLAMSGDISSCQKKGQRDWHLVRIEAREGAQHPTMPSPTPHIKPLSDPEYHQCSGC